MARTTAEKPATDTAEDTAEDTTEAPPAGEPVTEPAGEAAEEPVEREAPAEEDAGDAEEAPKGQAAEEAPKGQAGEDPEEARGAARKGRRRLTRDPVLLVAVACAVVAAACAAYFGRSWYAAAHDDSLAYSRDRDAVLRAAEQGVQNMNTLDYRKVDQGLTSWEDSSTGDLRQELVTGRAQFTAQVQQARTVTTAKILDGAVTELDTRAGKAGAIVGVQITVTPPSGAPTTKQSRMRAQLTRTPSGWKLSALGQAPVGSTAGG